MQETFGYLPQQRKLTDQETSDIRKMLKMKANKKLLQEHIQTSLGKKVKLKDLHNVALASKEIHDSTLNELVEEMKKIAGVF